MKDLPPCPLGDSCRHYGRIPARRLAPYLLRTQQETAVFSRGRKATVLSRACPADIDGLDSCHYSWDKNHFMSKRLQDFYTYLYFRTSQDLMTSVVD